MDGLIEGSDGKLRCAWHGNLADYLRYHDEEWGRPVVDDVRLFEKLCLEGFQSGLSWLTILRKRENFRAAFQGFDFRALARADVEQAMQLHLADSGIVRHRGKIASVYNNARRAVDLADEYGTLAAYFWSFKPGPDERPTSFDWATLRAMPTTPTSVRLSKELKKRGWSFVGPTTVYAFMQAMGMVNDHVEGCVCREPVERAQSDFKPPLSP